MKYLVIKILRYYQVDMNPLFISSINLEDLFIRPQSVCCSFKTAKMGRRLVSITSPPFAYIMVSLWNFYISKWWSDDDDKRRCFWDKMNRVITSVMVAPLSLCAPIHKTWSHIYTTKHNKTQQNTAKHNTTQHNISCAHTYTTWSRLVQFLYLRITSCFFFFCHLRVQQE